MKQDNYTAKLIIRGLPKMEELELRDLIIWLEGKVKELRDEYSKPLPPKTYNKIYTSRLMWRLRNKSIISLHKSPHNPE